MLKIIKPGTKTIATCKSCGCEFSYEAEDVNHTRTEEVIYGMPALYIGSYVICPQCAKAVMIYEKLI